MAAGDEGFLRRWSRLKRTPDAPPETAGKDLAAPPAAGAPDLPAVGDGTGPAPAAEDLPPVEDLTGDSDFTAFMGEGVPDEIRNSALRKLWRTDPVFANLDGLNDYDEDFGAIMKAGQEAMRRLAEAARADGGGRSRDEAQADREKAARQGGHERSPDSDPGKAAAAVAADPDTEDGNSV